MLWDGPGTTSIQGLHLFCCQVPLTCPGNSCKGGKNPQAQGTGCAYHCNSLEPQIGPTQPPQTSVPPSHPGWGTPSPGSAASSEQWEGRRTQRTEAGTAGLGCRAGTQRSLLQDSGVPVGQSPLAHSGWLRITPSITLSRAGGPLDTAAENKGHGTHSPLLSKNFPRVPPSTCTGLGGPASLLPPSRRSPTPWLPPHLAQPSSALGSCQGQVIPPSGGHGEGGYKGGFQVLPPGRTPPCPLGSTTQGPAEDPPGLAEARQTHEVPKVTPRMARGAPAQPRGSLSWTS